MTNEQNDLSSIWDESYLRLENHVFYPCEEIVRFVSRHLRRRVGLDKIIDVLPNAEGSRVIDIGCGIGRNILFGTEMGLEMYGIDHSAQAVSVAQEWLGRNVGSIAKERVVASDVRELAWEDAFFEHAISDSALDSMPFEVAQAGVSEIARVVKPGGYFYCNLISGDETGRDPEFCEEVVVQGQHEHNTIQSYFNHIKIVRLFEPLFEIISCQLHQITDPQKGTRIGRWHIVSRRR